MTLTRHWTLTALLLAACLVAGALLTHLVYRGISLAHGDEVAELDAGPPPLDAGPVAAPAPPAKLDPASLPDPIDHPAEALGVLGQARKSGYGWLAAILALALAGKAYVRRAQPSPDEQPLDPRGWRARSIVIVSAAVVLLLAIADKLVGAGAWPAVIGAAFGSALAIMDAINPPKGSAKSAA